MSKIECIDTNICQYTNVTLSYDSISTMDLCPICLDDMRWKVVVTRCGHQFHQECLQSWKQTSCPCCRAHTGNLQFACPIADKIYKKLVAIDLFVQKVDAFLSTVAFFVLQVLVTLILLSLLVGNL